MSFTTEGVDTAKKSKMSKFLTYGGPQHLKISSITVETASTGAKRAVFNMEGDPVTTEGFQGEEGAKGQIGRVRTYYMKDDNGFNNFLTDIGIIADKIGNRDVVNTIKADNFEEYIEQLNKRITEHYLWFVITGEEYLKQDGTIGVTLHFRRYGFVASNTEGPGHLKPYDKSNKYDYKPYVDNRTTVTGKDDLPWED